VRILLDTHALLWWFADDPALPVRIEALIDDPANTIFVSAASAWECTKVRIGKLATGHKLSYAKTSAITLNATTSPHYRSRSSMVASPAGCLASIKFTPSECL